MISYKQFLIESQQFSSAKELNDYLLMRTGIKESPEIEAQILQLLTPLEIAFYALNRRPAQRWPEAEDILNKDPKTAKLYAYHNIQGFWPEAEKTIKKDPRQWKEYLSLLGGVPPTIKSRMSMKSEESIRQVANGDMDREGINLELGDIYYTDKKDRLHRIGGPAVIFTDGTEEWYIHDKLHRLDGPAVTCLDGSCFYWLDNKNIKNTIDIPEKTKWLLLNGNLENIEAINNPTIEMQKLVITQRPDLIKKIDNLDPKLKEKYKNELNLAGIEI